VENQWHLTLTYAVKFAKFARIWGLKPDELADLVHLARRRRNAVCRFDSTAAETWETRLADAAAGMGLEVRWSGVWPTVRRGDGWGAAEFLPGWE
jgi:hypothetical protein